MREIPTDLSPTSIRSLEQPKRQYYTRIKTFFEGGGGEGILIVISLAQEVGVISLLRRLSVSWLVFCFALVTYPLRGERLRHFVFGFLNF